ncbi:MAG: competence protein ComA [Ruminococcaceae bacterium]|nr:competence protein ComA [Oscillospiraceae bacterium]
MLSIDITDRQIKLVIGVHSGSKVRVQDADIRELTLGMVSNGYITDVPMVAAELNDIIKTKGIKEKDAIVSITSSSIVYKELLLPKPKSLKNTVAIEAMIQSNMGVTNEFNISYTIAGEVEDEEKNKMIKVIASACPQRLVDGYVRLFSHIGLNLRAVNISNNSVTRLIVNTPKMADRMPLLLIQIDKNFLNMNLYEDNQIVFSRYFNIDPADYDNAPDYVTKAVYDNLFRMIQFIKSRKGAKPLKEIMFYGDIQNFIELSNAISSFNVPAYVLATPSTVITMAEIDFTKYANAIGAIYRRNKDLEHINLLEATSAKESKGMNGYLLGLLGCCVASAALVFGVGLVFDILNNNKKSEIQAVQAEIDDPQLQKDIEIVGMREAMLEGFESYNSSMDQVKLLFNYQPKVLSDVYKRFESPIEHVLEPGQELFIKGYSINGYEVSVDFIGKCKGDPSAIPSKYAQYLSENVLNQHNEPYFTNVSYTGFDKENSSDGVIYSYLRTEGESVYDTIFTFSIDMKLQVGNDEVNAYLEIEETEENAEQEVAE